MKPCNNLLGRLIGHDYQGRYTVEEYTFPSIFDQPFVSVKCAEVSQDTYKKTYHGDVCSRCGDVINIPKQEDV
jgi:hypothetical protein